VTVLGGNIPAVIKRSKTMALTEKYGAPLARAQNEKLISAGPKSYEMPELVRVDSARKLLQGNTYTAPYCDCNCQGTTNYPPRC
jgi:hypothetical protein